MNIRLKVLRGGNAGEEFAIPTPRCLIGRNPDCHVQLENAAVSRRHCLVSVRGGRVFVQDLQSHNGTFVNGEMLLEECEVQDGERLQIGPLVLGIHIQRGLAGKQNHVGASDRRAAGSTTGDRQAFHDSEESEAIVGWLQEADERERLLRLENPETRQMRRESTSEFQRRQARAAENRDEHKMQPRATSAAGKEALHHHAHVVGKLPPRPQEISKDSSEAAAHALKSFFERRW